MHIIYFKIKHFDFNFRERGIKISPLSYVVVSIVSVIKIQIYFFKKIARVLAQVQRMHKHRTHNKVKHKNIIKYTNDNKKNS